MQERLENLIPIIITQDNNPLISARDLHSFFGIKTNFRLWYPKMLEYGFLENEDYSKVYEKNSTIDGNQTVVDYMMSLSMAKAISMIHPSKKGKEARTYFINLEKKFKQVKRALQSLDEARDRKISEEAVKNSIEKSKPAYRESSIVNSKSNYINSTDYAGQYIEPTYQNITYTEESPNTLKSNFRDTSKLFGIRENLFVNWLLLNNYCYRDKQGNIKPYAKVMDYFYLREFAAESGHCGIQTMINAKGREFFRKLLIEENVIKEKVKLLE